MSKSASRPSANGTGPTTTSSSIRVIQPVSPLRATTTTSPIRTTSSALPVPATRSSVSSGPQPRLNLVSCLTDSTLRLTVSNHTLLDALGRTGYIASNHQFQFDGPPQSGAIYTSGWSICPVKDQSDLASADLDFGLTLALGGSTTFWQCLCGSFYNLYTENWAAQCSAVEIRIVGFVQCEDE